MKKTIKIALLLFAFANYFQVHAQFLENNPCTATCLDPNVNFISGRTPAANGFSPNVNLPCGGGTSEDNPTWFVFRPSGTSFTFSFSTSNYIPANANATQVTVWQGAQCSTIGSLGSCVVASSGIIIVPTFPGDQYYIQVDGLQESQCDLVISYDKSQLIGSNNSPSVSITGAKQICKNGDGQYCAVASFTPNTYRWTLNPSSAGTIAAVSGKPECANVRISNPPASGKVQVCVEPLFTGKCSAPTKRFCYDVDVIDIKPTTCSVSICSEQQPFTYNLSNCVKGDITPSTYIINLPPGTKKIQNIPYTLSGTSCGSTIALDINVSDKKVISLPPVILCEGETRIVKGNDFSCASASNALKRILIESTNRPTSCDSTFEFLIQCISIKPKILSIGSGILDCNNKDVTLNAAGLASITLPKDITNNIFQGKGKRTYQWSKNGVPIAGAINPTLVVSTAGDYAVMLSYTYEITQLINGIQVKVSKTCSKSASFKVIGTSLTTVAETPTLQTSACPNKVSIFSVVPDPNAQSYQWTVTNGATIVGSSTNPSKLEVKNSTLPYQVCLTKNACNQTSVPNCIDITSNVPLVKPSLIGKKSLCRGDSSSYAIIKTAYDSTVHYSWSVLGGSLHNFNTDSSEVDIKWSKTDSIGKIIIKVNDFCSAAYDTIKIKLKNCVVCGTSDAGKMKLKPLLIANNINKKLTGKHDTGTEKIDVNHTFAFVLHEGSSNKIVNPIDINKIGTFGFISGKMFCNRIYTKTE